MSAVKRLSIIAGVVLVLSLLAACTSGPSTTTTTTPTATSPTVSPTPTPTVSPTPTTTAGPYNQYQLEYILFAFYPDYFWCDPDVYPIAHGDEQTSANTQFPAIQANAAEFAAILEHLQMAPVTNYSDADKLAIYRQYKLLNHAVSLTPAGANAFSYSIRTGRNQGWHIEGTVTTSGVVTQTLKETSFNTCPICLTRGTLIATPAGQIAVEDLQPGEIVWTQDGAGQRVAAPILKTSATPVPQPFNVLRVTLADGRTVTASPGHPTAEMRPLSDYQAGDILDGSRIVTIESVEYSGGATFDLLPAGGTGRYWANGILLGSTLNAG